MSKNALNSNVSPISALINQTMNDADKADNRCAALVEAMFKAEVSFSLASIVNTFGKEGADRVTDIDTMLTLHSDDYRAYADRYDVLTHKDHKAKVKSLSRTEQDKNAFETQAVKAKLTAARMMFTRALTAVAYLREGQCTRFDKFNGSKSAYKVRIFDKEQADYILETLSVAEMIKRGDKTLRELTGKAKKTTGRAATAKNPVTAALADSSKALAAVLTGVNAKGVKPMTDFATEVETNLEATFTQLFGMKFFDGKKFDKNTFIEWIGATYGNDVSAAFKAPAAKKVAKPAAEDKKAA